MNVAQPQTAAEAPSHWLDPVFAPWEGNASAMARDLGELPVTVSQWRFRGRVPDKRWETIIVKAAALGFTLTHRDFIHPDHRVDAAAALTGQ